MTAVIEAVSYDTLYIGGEWVAPSGKDTITLISPSTEESVGTVPEASPADADRAVTAARQAFDDPSGWSRWDPAKRAEVLERFAVELEARGAETARRVTIQNGMPLALSTAVEATGPATLLRYYAQMAKERPAEEARPGLAGGTTLVRRDPVGVVVAIVPWNVPQALTFMKVAPALAAGCSIVIKPSPETVLDQYTMAEAAEAAGIPAGVLNVVQGGRELGSYLVSHPGVDKVAFTGSTAAGRQIAETCGRLLRPVSLELGGKSAAIVLDDAQLQDNLQNLFVATLFNNGQTCWLNSRILAPRSRYDDVLEVFGGLLEGVKIGDPLDRETQVGPLTSANQRDRVESYIAKGREEGARVVVGGGRPEGMQKGFFVEPTLFADVEAGHTIAQEEIFGPVLSVIPYTDVDDAVRIANDSEFGLGGSVWTQDHGLGVQVARRVQTGSIGINAYANDPGAPFGGVKASGMGRELGPEGMDAYFVLKSIYLDPEHPDHPEPHTPVAG
jgi:acyl-CoA reductase-like NAD-dependent aldehyde dehydrogenase